MLGAGVIARELVGVALNMCLVRVIARELVGVALNMCLVRVIS